MNGHTTVATTPWRLPATREVCTRGWRGDSVWIAGVYRVAMTPRCDGIRGDGSVSREGGYCRSMPKADLVEELRQGRGLRQDTQTDDICDEVAEVWLTREQVTLHAFRTAASKARTFTTIAAAFVGASPPTQILDTARASGRLPNADAGDIAMATCGLPRGPSRRRRGRGLTPLPTPVAVRGVVARDVRVHGAGPILAT